MAAPEDTPGWQEWLSSMAGQEDMPLFLSQGSWSLSEQDAQDRHRFTFGDDLQDDCTSEADDEYCEASTRLVRTATVATAAPAGERSSKRSRSRPVLLKPTNFKLSKQSAPFKPCKPEQGKRLGKLPLEQAAKRTEGGAGEREKKGEGERGKGRNPPTGGSAS
jgi:hypothetical protein